MLTSIIDPISNKICDVTFNEQEYFLWDVLSAACGENCPPDNVDYLCESREVPAISEEEICKRCYLNWAAQAGIPRTPFAKRLVQTIEMACDNKCPPDTRDYICQAGEDEDTSIENCTRCLMRWAAMPFWKERKRV